MEEKTEMESPLAQDCVVMAQEDSTSVDPGVKAIRVMPTTPAKKVIDDLASLLSDNSSVDVNCHNEILTFPNKDTSMMESALAKFSSKAVQEQNFTEWKPNKERLDNQREEVPLKCKDCENNVSSESNSLPVSRKRPATDFLPINAEIKKIGVEISEEQAQLLKNEVRRLSPIHVSLRERTLGEISLISEPRIFVDEQDRFALKEDGELSSSASESEIQEDRPKTYGIRGLMDSDNSFGKLGNVDETRMGGCDGKNVDKQSMLAENKLKSRLDSIVLNESGSSVKVEPKTPSKENSKGIRELALVLSRVDVVNSPIKENGISVEGCVNIRQDSCLEKNKGVISDKREDDKQSGELEVNYSRTLSLTDKDMGLVTERCASYVHDGITSKSEVLIKEKLDVNDELSIGDIESPQKTIQILVTDKIQRVSKIEEDQEIVFARSTFEVDESHPEKSGQQPSELRTIPISFQSQKSLDTEETETGSNISEVMTSITTVQFVDGHHHVIADLIPSSENEPLICDDISPEIMTRLETERPEAFTEDSAESLTLATGSRDEVRSDGSDSGLGSEIPGDPGPTPAPESDSETSFLDRIPDEILSDKDKAVNQLETFVPDINGQCTPTTSLPTFRTPPKSNLKRRLVDCMESERSAKRINTDEPTNKKRNIHFDAVTVYYFPRAQGFTCVPSQGGSTLGMSATHTHAERFSLSEHAAEQRRLHRARLAQLRTERAANCVTEAASSSEDPSDDTDEEPSDTEELDIDSYYFLQPVPTWQRRALLRAAGVRRIDAVEKDECRDIRASREHCGCGCKGYCDPESCPCSRANVKCQVDRAGFPCGCSRDGCANSSGRIEFNPVRVRTHFIHTLMRLELDKKQRDEEHTDQDLMDNHHSGRGPLREVPLGSVMDNSADACINGGGFTTLHYENHDNIGPSCHQDVTGVREDSLDLYAIRDDCYPSEDAVDCSHNSQRKLHPEFHQTFQTFPGHPNSTVAFHQNAYADYQSYQNLPSTSRATFQPQFSLTGNSGFSHYGGYPTDGSMQVNCQTHPGQHATIYETPFAQDEVTGSQYTNLNPVQPMNAVVQQTGKLEPFSELLASRYSYYGELEPQNHGNYHTSVAKLETEKGEGSEQQAENTDECDENFGEIIKKSMVETVSA